MFLPLDELTFRGGSRRGPLRAAVTSVLTDRTKPSVAKKAALKRLDGLQNFDRFLSRLLEDFSDAPNTAEVARAIHGGWVSDAAFPVALVTELISNRGIRVDTRSDSWREYTRRYGEAIILASELA